ncbi:lysylphosphatidylglycerol synthase domain-containing protein [Lysobacter enzymogenes]|uniref:lysylphosphatidylglycerol synthase domain-containing protein n=1 Tax=Lysobacter enzymogenes TaxID=69 RepID=UPI001A978C65|nr:lysylphosphatidylglycerol synthase domain-containing protein [Lysobacter enzymogenes]QQP98506.1 flippase-like domain-containing protein [Lysobacter enzymogenes]
MTWALILAAGAFLVRVLAPQMALVGTSIRDVRWWQVAAAIVVATPMYALKGWYHLNLLDRLNRGRSSRREALPIYLQAQIVRYLPGKIWGVVYQSQRMAATHRASDVVIANLWQMATTNALAVGLVVSLLLALRVSMAWLLLLVPVVLAVEWLHRHPAIETWGLRLLSRFLPKLAPLASSEPVPPMPWKGTALLCSEWIFYFLAFAAILYGRVGWYEWALLGTWYGGASVLALAAFVVPAGIAVREAIFVSAPSLIGVDAATLAVTAALARLAFLAAEIAAAAFATVFALALRPRRERR